MAALCPSRIRREWIENRLSLPGILTVMVNVLTSRCLKLRRASAMTLFLLALLASRCHAEEHFILCSEGSGSFRIQFRTGVSVRLGPSSTGDLSTRSCEATLSWDKHTQTVSTGSAQLDLDAFGVDLGLGAPVAAFQVKKLADDCCMDYLIYSLSNPPRLQRGPRRRGAAWTRSRWPQQVEV